MMASEELDRSKDSTTRGELGSPAPYWQ